ncbi:MAG TPA: outer membrane beta-barrel protein [Lentimicrobium sp.]|nr:outer membrane beta-barrel protein [Lentimicrobium sp.]
MKNKLQFLFLIAGLLVFQAREVNAQRIMGALIGGVNATQVDGDEAFGYHKFGLNVGAAAIIPIEGNWSITLENVYSEKGSHQRAQFKDSLDGSYDLKINYLDVPLLVQYTDKGIVTFGLGGSWGGMVKIWEQRNGNEITSTTLTSGIYKRSDLNFLMNVKFRLVQKLHFDVRYGYSLRPIATREVVDSKTGTPNIRSQYNGMFTFRLYYIFNEKISERVRTGQKAK